MIAKLFDLLQLQRFVGAGIGLEATVRTTIGATAAWLDGVELWSRGQVLTLSVVRSRWVCPGYSLRGPLRQP